MFEDEPGLSFFIRLIITNTPFDETFRNTMLAYQLIHNKNVKYQQHSISYFQLVIYQLWTKCFWTLLS